MITAEHKPPQLLPDRPVGLPGYMYRSVVDDVQYLVVDCKRYIRDRE